MEKLKKNRSPKIFQPKFFVSKQNRKNLFWEIGIFWGGESVNRQLGETPGYNHS